MSASANHAAAMYLILPLVPKRHQAAEWTPAPPEHPKVIINSRTHDLRDVHELARGDGAELPRETVGQFLEMMLIER
jgi:hypothetical protein